MINYYKQMKNRLLSIFVKMFRCFTHVCQQGFASIRIFLNTIQYNTIQYNTIQYNTIQYNTIQYNTHNDAALLSAIPNGELRTPICKTLFQLGKNNLDTFGGCQKFFPVLATHNPTKN
jgi:hypothetical protein